MRTFAGTLFVTAALAVPAAPADAVASGFLCSYTGVSNAPGAQRHAELDGGPLVVDDLGESGPVTLTCSLQHWYDERHGDPDVAAATSLPAPHVAVLPPTPVPVPDENDGYFVLCTSASVGGVTYYWDVDDDFSNPDGGAWSTDPAARCVPAWSWIGPEPVDPVEELEALLDAIVCPPLRAFLPGHEPTWSLVWGCP